MPNVFGIPDELLGTFLAPQGVSALAPATPAGAIPPTFGTAAPVVPSVADQAQVGASQVNPIPLPQPALPPPIAPPAPALGPPAPPIGAPQGIVPPGIGGPLPLQGQIPDSAAPAGGENPILKALKGLKAPAAPSTATVRPPAVPKIPDGSGNIGQLLNILQQNQAQATGGQVDPILLSKLLGR